MRFDSTGGGYRRKFKADADFPHYILSVNCSLIRLCGGVFSGKTIVRPEEVVNGPDFKL